MFYGWKCFYKVYVFRPGRICVTHSVSVADQYFEQTTDRTAVLMTLLTRHCADFKIGSAPYQNAYMFHIFTGVSVKI